MVDLAARHRRVAERAEARVLEVLRSGRYVGGPVVEEAASRLATTFGWRFGVGVNSGTDALVYGLLALGVRPGARVAIPAVTFFATAGAVCRIGAVPVVCDVRRDAPVLDAAGIPSGVDFVVAVHLFGEPCPLPGVAAPILDDAAQCIGADPPPRTGEVAAASFYPTKTLGAAGDAGIVLTDDRRLADRVVRLTHHGIAGASYFAEAIDGVVGSNSRLDAVQAAFLLAHLDDLPRRVARRREIAERYDLELPPWMDRLPRRVGHPVHQYVVTCAERDQVRAGLDERGVDTAVYYPHVLADMPALHGRCEVAGDLPNARRFCAGALALPVHEELVDDEVERTIAAAWSLRGP